MATGRVRGTGKKLVEERMPATPDQVLKIRETAEDLLEVPINELVTKPEWGAITFEAARKDLELIFSLARHLLQLPVELVPQGVATTFLQSLTQSRDIIKSISAFELEGSPREQRDAIVQSVTANAESLLGTTQGWIAFLAYQRGDVQKNIEVMAAAVSDAKRFLDESKTATASTAKEISDIVTTAREASAGAGVGVFTQDFANQAQALDVTAKNWLKATAGVATITLIAAISSVFFRIESDSNAEVAHFLTSKVLALVVLISATIWCGRIYKATMHQATTNRHRANALLTFQAFTKAASDDSTRNAVLIESTRSIFAIAPSGYLDTTESTPDGGLKVLEVIKGMNGKGD